jgi:electron transfer flavoprotein alpha subunit
VTGLRTVALVKQVPRGEFTLDDGGRLTREGRKAEINPWCRRAVAQAVRLGAATVLTMGPPSAVDVGREATACGARRAVHLSDPVLAGADCLVTARALAAAVRRLGPVDLVLAGRSSTDGSTGAIGPMVAELLGLPFAGPALELTVDGAVAHATLQHDGGLETVTVTLPAVIAVAERSCAPAKAPSGEWPGPEVVERWTAADLDAALDGAASPTAVSGMRRSSRTRRRLRCEGSLADQTRQALAALDLAAAERVAPQRVPEVPADGAPVLVVSAGRDEQAVRALLGEAAALAMGPVVAVGPWLSGPTPASWGADEILELSGREPRQVAQALDAWIGRTGLPGAILAGATSWDREVLARLGVRLGAGLMSDLVGLERHGGTLVGLKAAGDGLVAEIVSLAAPSIATLRTGNLALRTPRTPRMPAARALSVDEDPAVRRHHWVAEDDYDALDRAEVVVGVGRGVDPAEYGLLEPLLSLLGAQLAATRKVTDAGWLPHSRQVGVTARGIAPRLYLALGMSGNPNHLVGAARAGTILAVNSDPAAPIFGQCDAGIVGDWREVVPLLVHELRASGLLATPAG